MIGPYPRYCDEFFVMVTYTDENLMMFETKPTDFASTQAAYKFFLKRFDLSIYEVKMYQRVIRIKDYSEV